MADISTLLSCGGPSDSAWDELYREYINNRILVFNNEVNDDVVEDIIMYILKWNMDDLNIPVEKRKKIRLFITTPGGNSFSGNILTDVILQSKTPIMGVGLDLVASAGFGLFLACDERVVFQGTSLLHHEGNLAIENSRSKFKQTTEFLDNMEARNKEYILSRIPGMTSEFYDEIYDQEYWMDAHKAKELGAIHKIIGEDCDLDYVL